MLENKELIDSIKNGTHKQFVFNQKEEWVECKCGRKAIFHRDGFLCGTITAYPCKYNRL
jgi:hypothetical protein